MLSTVISRFRLKPDVPNWPFLWIVLFLYTDVFWSDTPLNEKKSIPLLLSFRDTGVQKHQKMSAKYFDVNVKRRFPTHFLGIKVIYFEKASCECFKKLIFL